MTKNELTVSGIDVKYKKINKDDYISLTDLARFANPSEPKVPIATWMRNKDVISYLGLWEKLHNPDFKGHEFESFENAAGKHSFYLSPQKWIESTKQSELSQSREIMVERMPIEISLLNLQVG